ncbi:hypothetical protein OIU34_09865 [Pararhizobium sp. BT-229]|uniref:hypothetical protein n=1 Tax=Pararhizobium sp. BT-229 TaxID=2986923 RepID=UPI0021F7B830|nr:hypothetical protein [Pararhizobium sp. BT-229]MCV9962204.1 hypothetical protein [Pararhizobium sp. BT-229]
MLIPKTLLLSLALIGQSVLPAVAEPSLAPVQFGQVYTDLPGVKTQEEAEQEKVVVCEQSVVRLRGYPTYGLQRYQTVNNCRKGNGPVFQSPRTPPSIERQLRGFNY